MMWNCAPLPAAFGGPRVMSDNEMANAIYAWTWGGGTVLAGWKRVNAIHRLMLNQLHALGYVKTVRDIREWEALSPMVRPE